MFHIILYEPEIPPNAGNIMRLAANTGAMLHLIKPLGFKLDAANVRRAGLDYKELASVTLHESWAHCQTALVGARWFAVTTKGSYCYTEPQFKMNDAFVFGPESRGLPAQVLAEFPLQHRLYLPMQPGNRSLNLANAAAVMVYEAWRQQGFRKPLIN